MSWDFPHSKAKLFYLQDFFCVMQQNKQSRSASEIKTLYRQFFKNPTANRKTHSTKSPQFQQLKFLDIPNGLIKITFTY